MTTLRAVILDVDGTLVDSNAAHAESWADVFRAFGYTVTADQVRPLIGMGSDELMPRAIGVDRKSLLGEAMSARRKQIFHEQYLPTLKPLPGVRRLLERMRAQGLCLVVATSAEAEERHALLEVAGVEDLIQAIADAKAVAHSKPAPDLVLEALHQAHASPDEALFLGDTPHDLEAAQKAGVRMVGVRSGGWDAAGLAGAIALYEHPLDLYEHYDSSPFSP